MDIGDIEVYGFKKAFHGMRNPRNSWKFSDSYIDKNTNYNIEHFVLGKNDLILAQKLIKAGDSHCKFMRQIHAWTDINMPRYWWADMDTYTFNNKNSESSIYILFQKEGYITSDIFTFSNEDIDVLNVTIKRLNELKIAYSKTKDKKYIIRAKKLLPEGFLQLRTFDTTYAELRNIYHQRENHILEEEWKNIFCKQVASLPYAKELILFK